MHNLLTWRYKTVIGLAAGAIIVIFVFGQWAEGTRSAPDLCEDPFGIRAVAVAPKGRTLAVAAAAVAYYPILIYDLPTRRYLDSWPGHHGTVTCLAFSPGGQFLASAGGIYDPASGHRLSEIKLWHPTTGQEIGKSSLSAWAAIGLGLSSPTWTALPSIAGLCWLQVQMTPLQQDGDITAIAWSPIGGLLASAAKAGTKPGCGAVGVWDLTSHRRLWASAGNSHCVRFTSDDKFVVSDLESEGRPSIVWRDPRTGARHSSVALRSSASVMSIAETDDGKWLATGDGDGTITIWDGRRHTLNASLKAHDGPVAALIWWKGHLISGSGDCSVKVWHGMPPGQCAAVRLKRPIACMALTPDATALVVGTSHYEGLLVWRWGGVYVVPTTGWWALEGGEKH
jgi:WD40 repeat protein